MFGIFLLALAAGWSGYALPDDMLSGTGLRIAQGVALGIPGSAPGAPGSSSAASSPAGSSEPCTGSTCSPLPRWWSCWSSGSGCPGGSGRPSSPAPAAPRTTWSGYRSGRRRRPGHRPVLPHRRGADPDGRDHDDQPGLAVRAGRPRRGDAGSQPDWYTGFLDGALRLVPAGWEVVLAGPDLDARGPRAAGGRRALPALLAAYPFLESRVPATAASTISSTDPATPPPGRRSGPPASRSTAPCGPRAAPT